MKHLLIVSATAAEIAPLIDYLSANYKKIAEAVYQADDQKISLLITGVGMLHTGVGVTRFLMKNKVDFALNVGIAGAFDVGLQIGEVVEVRSDRFGDLGAQQQDGTFSDMFEMGFMDADSLPFESGAIHRVASPIFPLRLKGVDALTVNKVHGEETDILFVKNKYKVDIETMEGVAFFYACACEDVPFAAIRAISNIVEPRNRDNWDIPLAVRNLNEVLIKTVIRNVGF